MKSAGHIYHHGRRMREFAEWFRGNKHAAQGFHREVHTYQLCDLRCPGPGGIYHNTRGYKTLAGFNSGNSVLVCKDAGHLSVLPQLCSLFDGARDEPGHYAVRINKSIGGAESAAQNIV